MRAIRVVHVSLVLALTLAAPAALAKKKDKEKYDHEHGHGGGPGVTVVAPHVDVNLVFASREREAARGWIVEDRGRGHCPPGLAKKNNGCLPPGQAKKRYRVGHRCPDGIEIRPIPPALELRIGVAPPGYRYGIIDGDIVKLAVGTMLVVDAIDGLVD
jgi:hypothetical protein